MSDPVEDSPPPFFTQGNFTPVDDEMTATDLPVEGALPPELDGLYARNGGNPVGDIGHWFMGDGMVHGVRIQDGKALWYRNRWVETPSLQRHRMQRESDRKGADGRPDRSVSLANTSIICHAGQIMALEEGSFPYLLDMELATLGFSDYEGKLDTAMSAHPKICPVTGELLFFGYSGTPPYLVYHRVDPSGRLVQSEEITVSGPTMMHDFAITETRSLFLDLPVVFDPGSAIMPYHWSDDYPARIGIMPRRGSDADVRWFDVDPCYIFHGLNAYDDGDSVVFEACRSSETWRRPGEIGGDGEGGKLTLHRFTFDLNSGTTKEETIEDRAVEFPRVADAMVGQRHKTGFFIQLGFGEDGTPGFQGILKYRTDTGARELHSFGAGRAATEPTFVPARGSDPAGEEGWVMSYVYDESTNKSELAVLDASDFRKPPVARIMLPRRVPFGFHGTWIPAANVG